MWKAHSRGLTGASKTSEIEADLIDGWMVPRNQGIWAKLGEVWLNYSNLLYQLDKSWPSHCRLGFGPMLSLRLLNTAFIFLADATSEMIQEESSVVQPGLLLPHDIIPSPTLGHLRDNSGLEIMCCLGLFFCAGGGEANTENNMYNIYQPNVWTMMTIMYTATQIQLWLINQLVSYIKLLMRSLSPCTIPQRYRPWRWRHLSSKDPRIVRNEELGTSCFASSQVSIFPGKL